MADLQHMLSELLQEAEAQVGQYSPEDCPLASDPLQHHGAAFLLSGGGYDWQCPLCHEEFCL